MISMETLQECSSCLKKIALSKISVNFKCPECKDATLWRCEACRLLKVPYECKNCGFSGP